MSTDHQDDTSQEQYHGLSVVEDRSCIAGWPTDTLSIDHIIKSDYLPHTIIVFIPGNPGVIHWYTDTLAKIVQQVGKGYAARGLSYAGHGVGEEVVGTNEDHLQSFHNEHLSTNSNINRGISNTNEGKRKKGQRNMSISWTMEGQIEHKIAWIDTILNDWKREHNTAPNLIFISHSIGAHFVQSLLIRRPDLLANTQHIIHLTPFLRFDPPTLKKLILSSTANSYKQTIPIMTTLVRALSYTLPKRWIDIYLDKVACLHCTKGRKIALDIFMNEKMVRNHLVLGFQELRELCEYPNDIALRLIGNSTASSILFCGSDQWAPEFHMHDLQRMKSSSEIPNNIHFEYIKEIRHDFVVHPEQIDPVVKFCVERIQKGGEEISRTQSVINLRSRL